MAWTRDTALAGAPRRCRPHLALGAGAPGSAGPACRCDESGLITLEWLLIVAAVAGLAASSVLAVQTVLDDTSELPADPHVRVIDADIAAALLAAEANAAELSESYSDAVFRPRCETDLYSAFRDVAERAVWTPPVTAAPDPPTLATRAKCAVELRAGLGG